MAIKITVVASDPIENVSATQVKNILKDAGIDAAAVNVRTISESAYQKALL